MLIMKVLSSLPCSFYQLIDPIKILASFASLHLFLLVTFNRRVVVKLQICKILLHEQLSIDIAIVVQSLITTEAIWRAGLILLFTHLTVPHLPALFAIIASADSQALAFLSPLSRHIVDCCDLTLCDIIRHAGYQRAMISALLRTSLIPTMWRVFFIIDYMKNMSASAKHPYHYSQQHIFFPPLKTWWLIIKFPNILGVVWHIFKQFLQHMQTTNAPQLIEHLIKSTNYTPYDVKWIPDSSKFMVCGERPRATGLIEITQLSKGELKVVSTIEHNRGIKSGTFAASPSSHQCFAFGDLEGKLSILDLEKEKVFWQVQAHTKVVNSVDGAGSEGHGYGPCEIVSGGRDGAVRVWDPRQKTPVISLDPVESDILPDCWTVSFGNAHNNEQRVVAAGYDNGDVKFFDMKNQMFIWDTNLKNGVCGIQFDRKDIIMNKLGAATLQGKFTLFDLRTFNPNLGYASLTESAQKATLWGIKHVPQNRDLFVTLGGNGALNLYKYHYPSQRSLKNSEGQEMGVTGKVELLNQRDICQQCISSFDWNRDKLGLSVMCGLDQTVRVMIATKLNLY